jgi:hypothetical protein
VSGSGEVIFNAIANLVDNAIKHGRAMSVLRRRGRRDGDDPWPQK